jgi:6-phosphogluconolactonase (cycloisomerase 2 family)
MKKLLVPAIVLLLTSIGMPPAYGDSCSTADAALNAANPRASDGIHHNLFVADTANNRVLVFTLNSDNTISNDVPRYVLGQADLKHCSAGTGRSAMNRPSALAVDSAQERLFVADEENNRVLIFSIAALGNNLPAAHVLGQVDFTSRGAAVTLSGMEHPRGVAFDAGQNRLFVVDANNDTRVLVFNTSKITDGMSAAGILSHPDAILRMPGKSSETAPKKADPPAPVEFLPAAIIPFS